MFGPWEVVPKPRDVLGPIWQMPGVDLLASRVNSKLGRVISRYRDFLVEAVYTLMYAFLPRKLLHYLLHRFRINCISKLFMMIFFAPDQPRQIYYNNLLKAPVDALRVLPDHPELLCHRQIYHPASQLLALTAWPLKPSF